MSNPKRAKLFLVDDHVLVLEGCLKLLEPYHDIVGMASSPLELMDHIQRADPEIVLMDISMPGGTGFEVARNIKRSFPTVQIIFVSMHIEATYIMEGFRAGGLGYVPKQTVGVELLHAISKVMEKRPYLSPVIPEQIRNTVLDELNGIPVTEFSGKLTPRQTEVLRLIAQGLSAKDIAHTLNIALSTVAFHKGKIMQALGLKSKSQLTRYAIRLGITSLD